MKYKPSLRAASGLGKPANDRATLRDVARYSGVSYQTVSRVINNKPYVASDTAERVKQAIRELDFRPHRVARSLATARTGAIAVVTHGITYYGLARLLAGVEQAAAQEGYHLLYSNVAGSSQAEIRGALERLNDYLVDGIITILPIQGTEYERVASFCGLTPVVQVDAELGVSAPSVVIDHRYGTRLVTQHLVDLGHKRVAEIRGPRNSFSAAARHEGWTDTLSAAVLEPGISVVGDWTAASGYRAAKELLMMDPRFTALVAANDQMALGAMLALKEEGRLVPAHVSVVGYDDQPEAAYFSPPLTTVGLDYAHLGRRTLGYLLERMAAPNGPVVQHVIYPELVCRSSTSRCQD